MMAESFIFGTVGSPLSTPSKPGGSVGAVQHIAALGLGALGLGWVRSVRVTEDTCAQIKAAALEYHILVSVHAPYFINLNADNEEWPKSRKRLMDAAFFGNLAGATDIIFHSGSYFNQARETVLPIAIHRLAECVRELRDNDNPVILRPETMGKSALLGSLADTLEMAAAIPGVEPCLDFAHLHARAGDGSLNSYEEWINILIDYAKYLDMSTHPPLHIHLSGIEYSNKGERNHLPIRESDFDLAALLAALKTTGASGRILCESPLMEEDALYMQQCWQAL